MKRAWILLVLLMLPIGCNIPTPPPPPPPPPPPAITLPIGYDVIAENWMRTSFAGGFHEGDINGDGRVDWQDFADLSRMDSYGVTACDFCVGQVVLCPLQCPVCGQVGYRPTVCEYWQVEDPNAPLCEQEWYVNRDWDWYAKNRGVYYLHESEVRTLCGLPPELRPAICDSIPDPNTGESVSLYFRAAIPDPNTFPDCDGSFDGVCDDASDYWFFCRNCGRWIHVYYPQEYCDLVLERMCRTQQEATNARGQ